MTQCHPHKVSECPIPRLTEGVGQKCGSKEVPSHSVGCRKGVCLFCRNSRPGGSSGSLSLLPHRVNGRTFAEIEITAHRYQDFCLTMSGRKLGALWKPCQVLFLCPGGTEVGGKGLPVSLPAMGCQGTGHP